MRITFEVLEGPHTGQLFTFEGQESFVVGRAKKALFRLPKKDRYISRHHFVVEVNPPYVRLHDLDSRNGTYVNGQRVKSADLKHQDVIRLGHTRLQVTLEGVPETEEPLPDEEMVIDLERTDVVTPRNLAPAPLSPSTEEAVFTMPVVDPSSFPGSPLAPPPAAPTTVAAAQEQEQATDLSPFDEILADLGDQLELEASAIDDGPQETAAGEISLSVLVDEEMAVLPCPLCGQAWELSADTTAPWCGICAKAIRRLAQTCPGYRLVRELGRASTGVIYQAAREEDHAVVAVRHLTPEETMRPKRRQRFLNDLQQLRGLRHPGVVPLLDYVEAEGQLYLVMEYVRGQTAAQQLERVGPFPLAQALTVLDQILTALECAHALGVLHREIRPSSIMLENRAGGEQARLMDFALQWLCQIAHVSRYSLLQGQKETVYWTAPELVYNVKEATPASDLYSLAATVYTLLTGQPPFRGSGTAQELLRCVLEEEPAALQAWRPDVPAPLADLLHKALAKDPVNRFASATEFRHALAPLGSGLFS